MTKTFLSGSVWLGLAGAVLAACAVLGGSMAVRAAEPPLSVGLLAVQSPEEVAVGWRPVLDALSQDLDRAVTPHISEDYAAVVWALRAGSDQLAWLGNKSAIEAVDNAESEVIARKVYPGGVPGYHSVLITAAASPHASLEALFAEAGHLTLGWGDRNSTSGFLVPAYHLFAAKGREPSTTFRRLLTNSHDGNVMALLAGQVDAAVVASDHLEHFTAHHPGTAGKLRVLWRSPMIPSDPLVCRKDMPAALKSRIQAFFTGYGVEASGKSAVRLKAEQQVLADLNIERFAASNDSQLLPVRQIELFRRRLVVSADPDLSADERRRRLDAIGRDLEQVNRRLAEAEPVAASGFAGE